MQTLSKRISVDVIWRITYIELQQLKYQYRMQTPLFGWIDLPGTFILTHLRVLEQDKQEENIVIVEATLKLIENK